VIDAATRSLGVRIALANPDGVLRPGLFGDVSLTQDTSAAVLTVPRSAVLDSGTRQLVLVQVAEGRFEPRTVVVGERSGDVVEIRQGVSEGDRVVVSANFLIDAESNLQSALEGMSADKGEAAPAMPAAVTPPPTAKPAVGPIESTPRKPTPAPVDHRFHDAQPAAPTTAANAAHDHSAMEH
jgi:Cu(I)/Ag(I) efflux system membrane fusion protein